MKKKNKNGIVIPNQKMNWFGLDDTAKQLKKIDHRQKEFAKRNPKLFKK